MKRIATACLSALFVLACTSHAKSITVAPFEDAETELEAAVRELGCKDNGFVRKKTPLIAQENSFWCWAAAGQMVERFFKRTVKQCEIANAYCARKPVPCTGPGCCTLPADCCVKPEACLVPGWPPFESRKVRFARVPGPLTAREIVTEIACSKRPFLFAWEYTNGGGHIMAAVGFVTMDGQDFLLVKDPMPQKKGSPDYLSYSEFKAGPFRHWDDFYRLEEEP